MPENKTKPNQLSVAAYVAAIADQAQRTDAKSLIEMMQRATGEKPKM